MSDEDMTRVGHVVYLHGFASSPASSKAQRFGRELRARDVGFSCPDLNEPAFETLTVTRMLEATRLAIDAAPPGPVALVGSSLGGFVAVHAAAAAFGRGVVDRLILLAPAFEFGGNRLRQLGEHGIDEWRRRGLLSVFHYAHEQTRDVGFALYEDAAQYDAFAVTLDIPMLVFQGRQDASVDPAMVERWCATRRSAELHLLEDDHQLTASMDVIWAAARGWMGLPAEAQR